MEQIVFLVEEASEGGYIARSLEHSMFTEADDYEELKEMIADAVKCHFDAGKMTFSNYKESDY